MMHSFLDLMRNTSKTTRKGKKPKVTRDVLIEIDRNMPDKRCGRREYYNRVCNRLGVTRAAIYQARRRMEWNK